jgi:hypothetical protein
VGAVAVIYARLSTLWHAGAGGNHLIDHGSSVSQIAELDDDTLLALAATQPAGKA